jgi:hypothetical protein
MTGSSTRPRTQTFIFWSSASRRMRSIQGWAACRKIATALFGDTRAREAAATNMGLMYGLVDLVTLRAKQQLQKGTRPAEYEELPPDYQDHYPVFGDILDPYLRSAWLRLAIAWPIVHWAFSSPRLARLSGAMAHGRAKLEDQPGPAFRLAAGLQAIKNVGVVEWLAETLHRSLVLCAEQGMGWRDLDDDEEWPDTAGAPKAETTVQSLFKTIRDWLDRMVAGSHWPRAVGDEVKALLERHDIILEERPDPVLYRVEDAEVDAREQARTAERARTRRHAEFVPGPFSLPVIEAFASAGPPGPGLLTVLVNSRWGRKRFRAVVVRPAAEAMPGVEMNAKELRRHRRRKRSAFCRVRVYDGGRWAEPDHAVAGRERASADQMRPHGRRSAAAVGDPGQPYRARPERDFGACSGYRLLLTCRPMKPTRGQG